MVEGFVRPQKGAGFGGIGTFSLQGWAGVTEETAKPLEGGRPPPPGVVYGIKAASLPGWRLLPIKVTACEAGERAFISGGVFTSRQPWGKQRRASWKDENPGGHGTTRCGGMAAGEAGSRPTGEKTQTWTFAFFLPPGPRPRDGGCPSPFEPWKDGFVTEA
jgi:hypothetical protein